MPVIFLVLGILFVVTGIQNTTGDLFKLLGREFSGSDGKPSFVPWLMSITIIGSLGYYDKIQRLANAFLLLVMVVLVLVNKGVFDEFSKAFKFSSGSVGINPSSGFGGSIFDDIEGVLGGSPLAGKVTSNINKGLNIVSDLKNIGTSLQQYNFDNSLKKFDASNAAKGISLTSGSDYGT